ncbi:TniQ family protein [Bacillus firmus]|uniref:TniQ family protein n=1 Tax=Cytobacillus firmus TaxID=1399 RepID=UPI00157FDB60|nr:TniQ family protein [Cytobacillus firmus]NUH86153.1 TniQ family protein [Cytobacillus firmus]
MITLEGYTERSILYPVEPIQLGHWNSESLISYINRICVEHNISVSHFFHHFISPKYQEDLRWMISHHGEIPFRIVGKIISTEKYSQWFVDLIEQYTSKTDLINLTLFPLHNYLERSKSFTQTKKWCPVCYEHMKMSGVEIHDRLLWSLKFIDSCTEHNCSLLDSCFHCGKVINYMSPNGFYGYCQYCQNWLGKKTSPNISQEHLDWQCWVERNIHDFFLTGRDYNWPTREVFLQRVSELVNVITSAYKGALSYVSMETGIHLSTINKWKIGKVLPNLGLLLKLLYLFKIDFVRFLVVSPSSLYESIKLPGPKVKASPRKNKICPEELERGLSEIIKYEPPLSIKQAAEKLGVDSSTIRRGFKDKAQIIKSKYECYIRESKNEKVRLHLESVIEKNCYPPPTLGQVFKEIGISGREPYKKLFPKEYQLIKDRYSNYLKDRKEKKELMIKRKITEGILEHLERGDFPHYYKVMESKGLGVHWKHSIAYRHYQEELNKHTKQGFNCN